ncbi:hypothetical protein D3C81_1893200 [compost metagenome]
MVMEIKGPAVNSGPLRQISDRQPADPFFLQQFHERFINQPLGADYPKIPVFVRQWIHSFA